LQGDGKEKEMKKLRKSLTIEDKENIANIYGVACVNCKSQNNIQYHHIVPLCNGGKHIVTNIVPLCFECHCNAHDKKAFKEKPGSGRKPIVGAKELEENQELFEKYFNNEIGTKECKLILGVRRNTWSRILNRYKAQQDKKWQLRFKKFRNNVDILASQKEKIKTISRKKIEKQHDQERGNYASTKANIQEEEKAKK